MDEPSTAPNRFQFRISFVLFLIALVAVGCAGARYWRMYQDEDMSDFSATCLYLGPSLGTAVALLMGQGRAAVPAALAFILTTLWTAYLMFWKKVDGAAIYMPMVAFPLVPLFVTVRLSWQRVTLARAALGMAAAFVLGIFGMIFVPLTFR